MIKLIISEIEYYFTFLTVRGYSWIIGLIIDVIFILFIFFVWSVI